MKVTCNLYCIFNKNSICIKDAIEINGGECVSAERDYLCPISSELVEREKCNCFNCDQWKQIR
jgi:hypothetical protein